MSIAHLVFLVKRIHSNSPSESAKNRMTNDMFEVLKFLLLPTTCFQAQLGEYFGQPKKRRNEVTDEETSNNGSRKSSRRPATTEKKQQYDKRFADEEEGGDDEDEEEAGCGCCPFCSGLHKQLQVDRQVLKNYLRSEFGAKAAMKPDALVDLLWIESVTAQIVVNKSYQQVTRGDIEQLVLQLIAAKIVQFKITITTPSTFEVVDVELELGRTIQPITTTSILKTSDNLADERFWKGINVR